jgi:hypothetical protein
MTIQSELKENESSPWYQIWNNGSTYNRVETEMNLYVQMQSVLQAEWNEEKEKYKELKTATAADAIGKEVTTNAVPRRNYFNKDGVVEDVSLFPYHTSLYPLLSLYDASNMYIEHYNLFSTKTSLSKQQLTKERESQMNSDAAETASNLQCSEASIAWTLLYRPNVADDGFDFDGRWDYRIFLFKLVKDHVIKERDIRMHELSHHYRLVTAPEWYKNSPYGVEHFPETQLDQANLLLKVLKHALSDIQRDYKLAASVVLYMVRLTFLNNVGVLRQLLMIIDSEYMGEEMIKDGMSSRSEFYGLICFHIIYSGISDYTEDIDCCLSAFVTSTFLREFPILLPRESKDAVMNKRTKLLGSAVDVANSIPAEEGEIVGS